MICILGMFDSLSCHQTVFQSGYIILHCHQYCRKVPAVPTTLTKLGMVNTVGVQWYLSVSIGILLMTNEVEQLFMCLLAISRFSSVISSSK